MGQKIGMHMFWRIKSAIGKNRASTQRRTKKVLKHLGGLPPGGRASRKRLHWNCPGLIPLSSQEHDYRG